MANAKGKGKGKKGKGKGRAKSATGARKSQASGEESMLDKDAVDALLEQARNAGDPFLAVTLYQKVLQARPDDTSIMGEAADLMLHAGEPAAAKEVLARSILLGPEEGPDKYLYMAQLHEGREALGHYEKGLKLLRKQLADGGGAGETKEAEAALRQRACMAYCSVAELFMTDLCFEEDAETRCQDALDGSMRFDYGGPEPLNAVANLRLSQSRPEEASQSAEEAFRRLALCEPPPDHEFRVSLAKVLMECSSVNKSCSDKALQVLSGLMQEDDENVELWYLMAVAFNSLQPPDCESARAHLNTAAEMLSKIRTAQEDMGEEFAFEDQVQLVQEQLEATALLESKHDCEKDEDTDMREDSKPSTSKATDVVQEGPTEMDCA
ncbi:unnamed protein product [Ectocarpus sp. 12 AP-2014]